MSLYIYLSFLFWILSFLLLWSNHWVLMKMIHQDTHESKETWLPENLIWPFFPIFFSFGIFKKIRHGPRKKISTLLRMKIKQCVLHIDNKTYFYKFYLNSHQIHNSNTDENETFLFQIKKKNESFAFYKTFMIDWIIHIFHWSNQSMTPIDCHYIIIRCTQIFVKEFCCWSWVNLRI